MQTCSELKETSFGVTGKPKTKKASFGTAYFLDSTEKPRSLLIFKFIFSTEEEFFHRCTLEILSRAQFLPQE